MGEEWETEGEVQKEPMHVSFQGAIRELERETEKLRDLVDQVRGASQAETAIDSSKAPTIALSDFLKEGGAAVREACIQLKQHREALQELLF